MLRALAHRIAPILTPVAMSAALVTAGCEISSPVESEIELRAEGPSVWILEHGDDIAEDIVADPAFDELVLVGGQILGDLHAAQQLLPEEEIDSIAYTINQPWFPNVMGPGELLGHLGGNAEDLQQMRNLIDYLRAKHGLQEATAEDVGYVFELAVATEHAREVMTYTVADELDLQSNDWDACTAACYTIYISGFVLAFGLFIAAMAVGVATVPLGLIIIAVAIAVFDRAVAELQAALTTCLATCDGTVGDLDFCGDWDVCEEDEYCWKGVLGIGEDHCEPKKENGKVCSGDHKCLSGCCKYHFPSHPVSMVCRPASKCN